MQFPLDSCFVRKTMSDKIQSSVDAGVLTFSWGEQSLAVNYDDIPEHIRVQACLHGMRQKIGDAGAAAKGTPISTRWASMVVVYDRIYSDGERAQWNAERKASNPDEVLVEALLRFGIKHNRPATEAQMAARVSGLNKAEKLKLRVQLADLIQEIEKERLKDAPANDDLLDNLFND